MEWILGLLAAGGVYLLRINGKTESLDRRLSKKTDLNDKLKQMLYLRKGFEMSRCLMTFPFAEHPQLHGIVVDEHSRQICLLDGNFETEHLSVKLIAFADLLSCEIQVNGLPLALPQAAQLALQPLPKVPEANQIRQVIMIIHLKHRTHKSHRISFVEKARDDGQPALQRAKEWYFYLNQLIQQQSLL